MKKKNSTFANLDFLFILQNFFAVNLILSPAS